MIIITTLTMIRIVVAFNFKMTTQKFNVSCIQCNTYLNLVCLTLHCNFRLRCWPCVFILNNFYVASLMTIVSVLIATMWMLDEGATHHDLRNPRLLLAIQDKWLISDDPQRISDLRNRKSRKTLFPDTHENDFAAQRPTLGRSCS